MSSTTINSASATAAASQAALPPLHWSGHFEGTGNLTTHPDRRLSRHSKVGTIRELEVTLTPTTRAGFYRVVVRGVAMMPFCGGRGRPSRHHFKFERDMVLAETSRGKLRGRSDSYPFTLEVNLDQNTVSVGVGNYRTGSGEERQTLGFRGTGSVTSTTGQAVPYVPPPQSTPKVQTPEPCGFQREHKAVERHRMGVDPYYAFGPPGTYTERGFERSLVGRSCAELALMRKRRVQEARSGKAKTSFVPFKLVGRRSC